MMEDDLMLREKLNEAATADQQTQQRIILELAARPHETLTEMVGMKGQRGGRQIMLLRVLSIIGYPHNAQAIPWMIATADPNRGAWLETVQTVAELGSEVAAPYIVESLWGVNAYSRAIA